jgi:CheY-like chemotaxis protein
VSMRPLQILSLEDDPQDAELIQALLEPEEFDFVLTRASTRAGFVDALDRGELDLILADYTLPSFDGLSALKMALERCPDVPFIFVSGTLGEEVAIEALKIGATDYVLKTRLSRLVPSVHRALREARDRLNQKRTEEALRRSEAFEKNGNEYRAKVVRLHQAWAQLFMLDFDGVLSLCAMSYPNPDRAAHTERPVLGDPIPIDARICLILRGSAKLGAGEIDGALADLSIVRDGMDRQRVLLDWYWRMPLHSALTDIWLAKGDIEKARREAQEFLKASLKTRERTHQALAWEANARIAMISGDHDAVADCIGKALSIVERWEIPIAAWRVHATAAEAATHPEVARVQWRLSAETITRLADSLSRTEPLRETFLSAPPIRNILATQ